MHRRWIIVRYSVICDWIVGDISIAISIATGRHTTGDKATDGFEATRSIEQIGPFTYNTITQQNTVVSHRTSRTSSSSSSCKLKKFDVKRKK